MKRLINASRTFPKKGSAKGSDSRNGVYKFNAGKRIEFKNGVKFELSSAQVTMNAVTGQVNTYCNVFLEVWYHYQVCFESFSGCTPEEVEDIHSYFSTCSTSEAFDSLRDSGGEVYPDHY